MIQLQKEKPPVRTTEAEELALSLSDSERAKLAEELIASLPGPSIGDDDDWIDEAIRRSGDLKNNPTMAISLEELDRRIHEKFAWKQSFEKRDKMIAL